MNPSELQPPGSSENVVADYYDTYKDTQASIFRSESRRTRNSIFWIAGLLFVSDLLALLIANAITGQTLLMILIVPLAFAALGFFALKQPMLSVILAALLFAGLIIFVITITGARGAISGFLIKAIIIYFLFAGFQSAREAERARKEAGL